MVLHLTESIQNERMSTGAVSHIVASANLLQSFTAASTHLLTTTAHLKIIGPDSEDRGGGEICRGVSGVTSGDRKSIKILADKFISGKEWSQIIRENARPSAPSGGIITSSSPPKGKETSQITTVVAEEIS